MLEQVELHPELQALRVVVEAKRKAMDYAGARYPESEVRVGGGYGQEWPGGEAHSASVGVEFRIPFGVTRAHSASKAHARLEVRRYEWEAEQFAQSLQGRAIEAVQRLKAGRENWRLAAPSRNSCRAMRAITGPPSTASPPRPI